MTTHLLPPGLKPSFRRHDFKPKFHTHEWQRPTGGESDRPGTGRYAKFPKETVHLRSNLEELPKIRGRCSTSCASAADSTTRMARAALSALPGPRRGEEDFSGLESSASLAKQADALKLRADDEDVRAELLINSDFYRKLGITLFKLANGKTSFVLDLLRHWDRNGKGELSKTEFRIGVRTPPPFGLGLDHDHHHVDALFERLDTDQSANLEVDFLGRELEKMLQAAKTTLQEAEDIRAFAERLRHRTEAILQVAEKTVRAEKENAKLQSMCASRPVEVQIGSLILKKNIKIVDVLLKWDTSGDGLIDKSEFRTHTKELGVVAEAKAIDACFDKYDKDKGGTLDLAELKQTFKHLASIATEAQVQESRVQRTVTSAKKLAKRAQQQLRLEHASEVRAVFEAEAARERLAQEYAKAIEASDHDAGGSSEAVDAAEADGATEVGAAPAAELGDAAEAGSAAVGGAPAVSDERAAVAPDAEGRAKEARDDEGGGTAQGGQCSRRGSGAEMVGSEKTQDDDAAEASGAAEAVMTSADGSDEHESLPPRMASGLDEPDAEDEQDVDSAADESEEAPVEVEEVEPVRQWRRPSLSAEEKAAHGFHRRKKDGAMLDAQGAAWIG
jgi:Ca2+-binding EF-hand superfamily protein